jgi:transmembrane sensor
MAKTNSFIRDSDSLEQQAQAWLLHLQSGRATEQDADSFRNWQAQSPQHALAYEKARRLWHVLGVAAENVARRGREEGDKSPAMGCGFSRRAVLTGGAIAASAAWLAINPPMALWPAAGDFFADYRTGTGEQKQVQFNDHVIIELNTQTRLNRVSLDHDGEGIELLGGEAEFRTAAAAALGKELNLLVNQGWIVASTASFNVRFLTDEVCLTCLEGHVRLRHSQGVVDLMQGQQLTYNQQTISSRRAADLQQVEDWRSGWLVFRDTPLAQAVDEINRYRPGKLLLRNGSLATRRIRGRFAINELADIPAMIADSYGARITRLPGGITLLS